MAKSGADIADDEQATTGTWDHAPSQGSFIGRLAIVLIAVLVICALVGIIAGFIGSGAA